MTDGASFTDADDLDFFTKVVIDQHNIDELTAAIIEAELIVREISLYSDHPTVSPEHRVVLLEEVLGDISDIGILSDGFHAERHEGGSVEVEVGAVAEGELPGLDGLRYYELVVDGLGGEGGERIDAVGDPIVDERAFLFGLRLQNVRNLKSHLKGSQVGEKTCYFSVVLKIDQRTVSSASGKRVS